MRLSENIPYACGHGLPVRAVCLLAVMVLSGGDPAIAAGQHASAVRPSVTFVLGEDRDPANPYYRLAEAYFRQDAREGTETVVTDCASLADVLGYLERKRSDMPWGRISLVSHGNPYQGLRVAVVPGGRRASAQDITAAMADGSVNALSPRVTDSLTVIAVHGCGTAGEPGLVAALRQLFSDGRDRPAVDASPYFEYYVTGETPGGGQRFLADYWLLPYKKGYRPTDRSLARRLARRHPGVVVDWTAALAAGDGQQPGEVFHVEFDVPVKWVIPFRARGDMPVVDTRTRQLDWIQSNEEIMRDLESMELEPGQVNWWFREVYVKGKAGERRPALWIKGYSTMLCVLRLRPGD